MYLWYWKSHEAIEIRDGQRNKKPSNLNNQSLFGVVMGFVKCFRADRGKSPSRLTEAPDRFKTWTGRVQNTKIKKFEVEIQNPLNPSSYRSREKLNRRGDSTCWYISASHNRNSRSAGKCVWVSDRFPGTLPKVRKLFTHTEGVLETKQGVLKL